TLQQIAAHIDFRGHTTCPRTLIDHFVGHQARAYSIWIDRVYRNAISGMLQGILTHQCHQCRLRCAIRAEIRPRVYGLLADIEHDGTAGALLLHDLDRSPRNIMMAPEIEIERSLEQIVIDRGQSALKSCTRIGDEYI